MADAKKTTKTTTKAAKSTKAVEVKTIEQLNEELIARRNDFQESRRIHRMGELVNPHVLTTQRKDIARTLTALNQAQDASQKEAN